jgi:uncharacterized protein
MNLRRLNRAVHRDLGYFFFGMAVIYGISGIALNHRHQWNPNYIIVQEEYQLSLPASTNQGNRPAPDNEPGSPPPEAAVVPTDAMALSLFFLEQIGEENNYRTQLSAGQDGLRIFIEGGSMTVNLVSGNARLEKIRQRPVFYQVNFLHYNTPRKLWTWFSDLFAGGLIVLAITGLFVLKGKNGITRRGAWIASAGVIIPLVLLYIYLNG